MTPDQLNTEWTEERVLLYLEKRKKHFERVADAVAEQRDDADSGGERELPPRRVDASTLFRRIHEMQQKGGTCSVPLA